MVMRKYCPSHKQFDAVVEKDVLFYNYCMEHNGPIYPGHFVNVTDRCNLKCKYCFYDKGEQDIPIETILKNCLAAPGPYFLTGGEPTLRKDLHAVIEAIQTIGPVYLVTNGWGLQDQGELNAYATQLINADGIIDMALSYHEEAPWIENVINNIIDLELTLETMLFVVDSLDQLPKIKEFAEKHEKYFASFKIKLPTPLGREKKTSDLFTSDIIKWFCEQDGDTEFPSCGKTTYYKIKHNGILYPIVNWYSVQNVDLDEINCTPTYTTKDGKVMDFVKAIIYDEVLLDKAR